MFSHNERSHSRQIIIEIIMTSSGVTRVGHGWVAPNHCPFKKNNLSITTEAAKHEIFTFSPVFSPLILRIFVEPQC